MLKNEAINRIFGKVEIDTIIKKIKGAKLKQTEKNYLYRSIRPKLIAAEIVTKDGILKKINTKKKDLSLDIEANLSYYGYNMFSLKKKKAKKIEIEELIIKILNEYPKARFIEAIPILLIKNKVDNFKLLELAILYHVKNQLGYLLETALLIKPIAELKEILNYLKDNKEKEISYLITGDYEFLAKTSPKRIKEWNLLGRFFDEDFIKNAGGYL